MKKVGYIDKSTYVKREVVWRNGKSGREEEENEEEGGGGVVREEKGGRRRER